MGDPKNKENWLKSSGLEKPYALYQHLGCLFPLILSVTGSIVLLILRQPYWIPIVFMVIFPISNYFAKRVFVKKIFCPDCGFNPTRRKLDGEPRKDQSKVINQLESFEECPNCGISQGVSDVAAPKP